ncbi:hypothetical protein ACFP3I_11935 [Chryseobacterium arachidis]|uniref:hypothetical protein n=1 Tax=Chryseobacterium arachidis TaxID=1416778 RepID=UPI00360A1A49
MPLQVFPELFFRYIAYSRHKGKIYASRMIKRCGKRFVRRTYRNFFLCEAYRMIKNVGFMNNAADNTFQRWDLISRSITFDQFNIFSRIKITKSFLKIVIKRIKQISVFGIFTLMGCFKTI